MTLRINYNPFPLNEIVDINTVFEILCFDIQKLHDITI